jgi:hypothetical protein
MHPVGNQWWNMTAQGPVTTDGYLRDYTVTVETGAGTVTRDVTLPCPGQVLTLVVQPGGV